MSKKSEYFVDLPIIEQIMLDALVDAVNGYKPYPKRYGIKGLYGTEGEEIYEAAYFSYSGEKEDTELLASKWGYKFGDFERPTKIEKETA